MGDGGVWGWFVFWPTLYLPDYKCYVKLSKMRRESVLLLFFSPTLSCRIIRCSVKLLKYFVNL